MFTRKGTSHGHSSPRWATFLVTGGALTFASGMAQAGITYSGVLNTSHTSPDTYDVDFDGSGDDARFTLGAAGVSVQQYPGAKWEYLSDAGSPAFSSLGDLISAVSAYNAADNNLAYYSFGSWKGTYGSGNLNTPGYLGWRIDTGSGYKYGWAQLTANGVGPGDSTSLVLTDFAYQNALDTPIAAGDKGLSAVPEPSTFALIAAGVAGLAALRRRKRNDSGSSC